jgi:prepilin-type N-terminal cleavage/methylation domain-containing protein
MKSKQSGFTLIEIAIVLVIIGLLLGGVLKGQELINSAKVKNLATDFKNVPVYIYGYQDKFRALPGDDIQAGSHVLATTIATAATAGNGLIDGTGAWDTKTTTSTDETQLFWLDVRLANLAAGPTTGDLLPTNAVGGVIGVISSSAFSDPSKAAGLTNINASYIVCSSSIMGKYAKQLDIQMDDGNHSTGSLRIYSQLGGRDTALTIPTGTALSNGVPDDNQTFTVCMGI